MKRPCVHCWGIFFCCKSSDGELQRKMAAHAVSVLVTGANRGLGLEMVKQMVEASHPMRKLFACCRDPDGPRAEALQTLAKKHPNVIAVVRLDATDLCSIKQCAQQVGSVVGNGGLNLLINNAGMLAKGTLQETSTEDMQNTFNTNVMGPMNIIKEFLPHLRAAAKASGTPGMSSSKAAVVSISSFLASLEIVKQSYDSFPAISYRISKAGLNMLTVCAAEELKKDEILFSLLHPGWVRTDMGGDEGDIDAPESVQGMLSVMASLTEKQNGAFLDYKGKSLPW
ncbi:C-factor-like isoform X3 [Cyclopterus lumpus]|uniref:C-factor-like isoform X3 n=1 Tax=Cyclopterus lumpus TaxID=8103 RepID=UPI001486EC78|nr:C-factor-like isoform X3 [Cyclopterus lumpus]